ncbi:TIGR01212 family radical SAM protein [bacterium]|nr:TIGR01212 family radical SAM protein [bacterium]
MRAILITEFEAKSKGKTVPSISEDYLISELSERYYKFSTYLKRQFKTKVHKISIDAGFSCPNRNGVISKDGCVYCNNRGFSVNTKIPLPSLYLQIEEGIKRLRQRFKAEKFIVYFQAYTNTYADLMTLKQRYDSVKNFEDIVGISIATRPDCINEGILDLINSYTEDYEVWIEYGVQSIHQPTLEFINRGHLYEDFLKAVELTRKKEKIKIGAHLIIGLPFETEEMIQETAKALAILKLDGIKLHPLYIVKDTKLEMLFHQKLYQPLGLNKYLDLVIGFLEHLWPKTVIQRISADCPKELLVAPSWILNKSQVLQEVERRLLEEERFQGKLWQEIKK